MGIEVPKVQTQHQSKTRILDAAVQVIRAKGYSAMTIDDVCLAAGLTEGSFFHHFKNKEELALAAAGHFAAMADSLLAQASYRGLHDPLERLLGYVDFRMAILQGRLPEFTCLLGTMVQETFESHPAIREAVTRISAPMPPRSLRILPKPRLAMLPMRCGARRALGFTPRP
jgi:TetR/AcrR family transcriptional regulator, transcriptional repressor for nem operon